MTALMFPPSSNGLQKSLNANLDEGETTSLTLNNTTGIQNKPGVATINRIDTNGAVLSSSVREYVSFTGVSGSTLTGLVRGLGGSSDQDHATGEVVEFTHDVVVQQAVVDALANLVNTTTLAVDTTKVVTPTGTQTLTNKTLTAPDINGTELIIDADADTSMTADTDDQIDWKVGGSDAFRMKATDFDLVGATANLTVAGADPFKSIVIPAGSMKPTTTAGCSSPATVEAGTNDVDYVVLDFDTASDESCFTIFAMPDSWDGGTITFIPYWTAASGSGTVCFSVKGRAYANDDAIDQAYGTPQTSTDTLITAGDVHIGPASSAITIAGSPAGGQLVQLKITRDVSEDDLGVDARLIAIKIEYKVGQFSD